MFKKIFASCVVIFFLVDTSFPLYAKSEMSVPALIPITAEYNQPIVIKGINIYPAEPLKVDFIIDQGQTEKTTEEFHNESLKLIKYFLASLTIPEHEMWVNLSPLESQRIVPQEFGETEMGRDLLQQDLILKQLTASLLNPQNEIGEIFWDSIYQKVFEQFGSQEIPLDTYNKIWIVPDEAKLYEHEKGVFIINTHLKVMLEQDYEALRYHSGLDNQKTDIAGSKLETQILRQVLIPAIEKEVNEGPLFANLRQIYYSLVLAKWYKDRFQSSLIGQIFIDQHKTEGVKFKDSQNSVSRIYNQYVEAFKKGSDLIKEDYDPVNQTIIPKKYFSGGIVGRAKYKLTPDFDHALNAITHSKKVTVDFAALANNGNGNGKGNGNGNGKAKAYKRLMLSNDLKAQMGLAAFHNIIIFIENPEMGLDVIRQIIQAKIDEIQRWLLFPADFVRRGIMIKEDGSIEYLPKNGKGSLTDIEAPQEYLAERAIMVDDADDLIVLEELMRNLPEDEQNILFLPEQMDEIDPEEAEAFKILNLDPSNAKATAPPNIDPIIHQGKTVMITGGSGYVGHAMIKLLLENGCKVVIYDRTIHDEEFLKTLKNVTLISGDLLDKVSLKQAMETHHIDSVIHLASNNSVPESIEKPGKYFNNNLGGTINLLDVMAELKITNLVFATTTAVYSGEELNEEGQLDERISANSIITYAETKLLTEQLLKNYSLEKGINYVALRLPNVAGAFEWDINGEKQWFGEDLANPQMKLITRLIESRFNSNVKFKIMGNSFDTPDGTPLRVYIDVIDLANAMMRSLAHLYAYKKGFSTPLNLGAEERGATVKQIVNKLKTIVIEDPEFTDKWEEVQEVSARGPEPGSLLINGGKVFDQLGWTPSYEKNLEYMLRCMWKYHKQQEKKGAPHRNVKHENKNVISEESNVLSIFDTVVQNPVISKDRELKFDILFRLLIDVINSKKEKTELEEYLTKNGKKLESSVSKTNVLFQLVNTPPAEIDFEWRKIRQYSEKSSTSPSLIKIGKELVNILDHAMLNGGIDFNAGNLKYVMENKTGLNQTSNDPVLLKKYKNLTGFSPIIRDVETISNLKSLLTP